MGDSLPQPAKKTLIDQDDAFLPLCPVCGGATQPMSEVRPASMFACIDCATTVFVPPGAWATARRKRFTKWRMKTL